MAVSGSIDFGLVTNSLIDEAFDLCGIGSEGEGVTADQYERARRSLNLIVKAWGANEHLWLKTEATETLVASTSSYTLTPKPGRVLSVRRRDTDSIDVPLEEWARDQYFEGMTNKSAEGVPVAFHYDPQRDSGTLYVWPTPGTDEAAEYTLHYTYLRRMDDFDGSADDPDLPQEWTLALSYALAEQLALKYGTAPDIRREIAARAAEYKALIEAWDTEPASLFLQPGRR